MSETSEPVSALPGTHPATSASPVPVREAGETGEIERLRAELERLREVVCDEDRASIARCLGEQEGE